MHAFAAEVIASPAAGGAKRRAVDDGDQGASGGLSEISELRARLAAAESRAVGAAASGDIDFQEADGFMGYGGPSEWDGYHKGGKHKGKGGGGGKGWKGQGGGKGGGGAAIRDKLTLKLAREVAELQAGLQHCVVLPSTLLLAGRGKAAGQAFGAEIRAAGRGNGHKCGNAAHRVWASLITGMLEDAKGKFNEEQQRIHAAALELLTKHAAAVTTLAFLRDVVRFCKVQKAADGKGTDVLTKVVFTTTAAGEPLGRAAIDIMVALVGRYCEGPPGRGALELQLQAQVDSQW
jgi:hypothetical protein